MSPTSIVPTTGPGEAEKTESALAVAAVRIVVTDHMTQPVHADLIKAITVATTKTTTLPQVSATSSCKHKDKTRTMRAKVQTLSTPKDLTHTVAVATEATSVEDEETIEVAAEVTQPTVVAEEAPVPITGGKKPRLMKVPELSLKK